MPKFILTFSRSQEASACVAAPDVDALQKAARAVIEADRIAEDWEPTTSPWEFKYTEVPEDTFCEVALDADGEVSWTYMI